MMMSSKYNPGKLYIVSTPIGHNDDITLRAINTLRNSDVVICEELKEGQKLLKRLNIDKTLVSLNEHNEHEVVQNILIEIMSGKDHALISDCGTPVFFDPGKYLINTLSEMNIKIIPIPGPSSLGAALSVCNFNMQKFFFAGFLPPKSDQRIKQLKTLLEYDQPIILMDTPYRLTRLVEEVIDVYGKNQRICLASNLTLSSELIIHDSAINVYKQIKGQKREFVLIIDKPFKRNY